MIIKLGQKNYIKNQNGVTKNFIEKNLICDKKY